MATTRIPKQDLVLGDDVQLFPGPYGWGTVVRIEDGVAHVFRTYVHIADFEYTGGVLHYIGTETVKFSIEPRAGDAGLVTVDAANHARMTRPGALR